MPPLSFIRLITLPASICYSHCTGEEKGAEWGCYCTTASELWRRNLNLKPMVLTLWRQWEGKSHRTGPGTLPQVQLSELLRASSPLVLHCRWREARGKPLCEAEGALLPPWGLGRAGIQLGLRANKRLCPDSPPPALCWLYNLSSNLPHESGLFCFNIPFVYHLLLFVQLSSD